MNVWFPTIKGGSGSDVYTRRLACALDKYGVKAVISWFDSKYQFAPFLLKGISAPAETDIIHTNSWYGFAFKRKDIPLVITEHQGLYSLDRAHNSLVQKLYHTAVIRNYVKASCNKASAIIAVSEFVARAYKKMFSINDSTIIHNWIDTDTFFPSSANNANLEFPIKLLFVGNLTKLKGADMLPDIMHQLGDEFELYVAGALKGSVKKYSTKNTKYLGRLTSDEQCIDAYMNCDIVIIPSSYEGFGYVALEAMACGKPVIASNTTAIPEIVEDGVNGVLCPPRNIESFVSACRYLRDNPDKLKEYGRMGRIRAEKRFHETRAIPSYLSLYERLLSR